MATIAENLTKLQAARTNIADAITAKGGTVSQGDGFEEFPDDIATIPAGSGATKLSGEKAIDAYIMQTDEYVYMFGCVYPSGYRKVTLPIPDGFTLGTFIQGVSFQQYSTPSYVSYKFYRATISNNEVTLEQSTDYNSTSTNTWMIAVFNILS